MPTTDLDSLNLLFFVKKSRKLNGTALLLKKEMLEARKGRLDMLGFAAPFGTPRARGCQSVFMN